MDNYTATEQAYKNGYEQGLKDAVKEGEWVTEIIDKTERKISVTCSNCEAFFSLDLFDFGLCYNFCPNCGIKMKE